MKKCGVYKITNKINNNCYIGKSVDIEHRWKQHKYNYNKEKLKCYNYYLYRAFRKYGIENFNFEILELCERENLIEVETKYYNMYKRVYCMQSPKQDVRFYSKEWIQRCKEGWINKSQESKEKALKNLTKGKGGRVDKKSIVAICLSTQEKIFFDSLCDAETGLGIARSSISNILNSKNGRKKACGYTFEYFY